MVKASARLAWLLSLDHDPRLRRRFVRTGIAISRTDVAHWWLLDDLSLTPTCGR